MKTLMIVVGVVLVVIAADYVWPETRLGHYIGYGLVVWLTRSVW